MRRFVERLPRGLLWLVLVSWLAASIVGAGCLVYTQRTARASERKWCDLLVILDQGPQPSTPTGQRVRAELHKLRGEFGCD